MTIQIVAEKLRIFPILQDVDLETTPPSCKPRECGFIDVPLDADAIIRFMNETLPGVVAEQQARLDAENAIESVSLEVIPPTPNRAARRATAKKSGNGKAPAKAG